MNTKRLLELRNDYSVIDIETTGLNPGWDEIIEMTALRVRNNQIVDTYSSLVKPSQTIPPFIEKLTGITNEMVVNAPPYLLSYLHSSLLLVMMLF